MNHNRVFRTASPGSLQSKTRHLARQVGGASTGFVFIDFMIFVEIYLKFFADHAAKEEAPRRGVQAGLPNAH